MKINRRENFHVDILYIGLAWSSLQSAKINRHENVPLHFFRAVVPSSAVVKLFSHSSQDFGPTFPLYHPSGQGVHVVLSLLGCCPAGQFTITNTHGNHENTSV